MLSSTRNRALNRQFLDVAAMRKDTEGERKDETSRERETANREWGNLAES